MLISNDNTDWPLPSPIAEQLLQVGQSYAAEWAAQCRDARPRPSKEEALSWLRRMRQEVDRRAVKALAEMVDFADEYDPENDPYFEAAIFIAQSGADSFFRSLKRGGAR